MIYASGKSHADQPGCAAVKHRATNRLGVYKEARTSMGLKLLPQMAGGMC